MFAKFDNYDIFISEDMLTTIFYIDKNNQKVLSFFKNIVIKKWHIATFGEKTIKKAIDLSFNKKLDLEDTLQCFCAKENNCEFLITNDNQFYDCGINVCTANDFLKKQTKK
ncbi:putative protein [hydrothermal vent metagenome]|uniref:PIN domain-containing protein n=1 Tax=hydrothermal vent metagenome TaxID=652676 RepID=A0A1W1CPC2_9ZZZZ